MKNQVIDGRFLPLRKLGEGAAGEVFEATLLNDTSYAPTGTRLAIKIYKPWVLAQKNQSFRIERELLSGLNISSPNIIKSYEVGSHDGRMYLVMELLDGPLLKQWISEHDEFTFSDAIDMVKGIVKGLYTLHSHNLIHRDLKPENIIMTSRGPVILDLGVLGDVTTETVITGGEFLGTLRYSAPEYLFGEEYSNSIDIYSFGIILYEFLTCKSFIEDNLYWSKIIVKKAEDFRLKSSNFESGYDLVYPKLKHLNLKERVFLKGMADGCLTSFHYKSFYHGERFSAAQLCEAIESRLWENTFSYPVRERDNSFSIWPRLPYDLENKTISFMKKNKDFPSSKGARILMDVANSHYGNFPYLPKTGSSSEESNLLRWMFEEELMEDGQDVTLEPIYTCITPLAWQLILRGFIQ